MSIKVNTLLSASLLSAGLMGFAGTASANSVVYGDPVPATEETPCAGIGYEWTVKASKPASLGFVRTVGAKSWNEPPPAYTPPYTGWTHTSDWVAFELTRAATVRITIDRQQGVLMPSIVTDDATGTPSISYTPAGDKLYPALSLYRGWEEAGCEDHRYNTTGPTPWAPSLTYLASHPNTNGYAGVTLTRSLSAGKYSIAIGGANVSFCAAGSACYTGRHGYRATITTQ